MSHMTSGGGLESLLSVCPNQFQVSAFRSDDYLEVMLLSRPFPVRRMRGKFCFCDLLFLLMDKTLLYGSLITLNS